MPRLQKVMPRLQNSRRQYDAPRVADVSQQDVADLAVGSLVPVDAVSETPANVTPHGVVQVDNVESVVGRHATCVVIRQ